MQIWPLALPPRLVSSSPVSQSELCYIRRTFCIILRRAQTQKPPNPSRPLHCPATHDVFSVFEFFARDHRSKQTPYQSTDCGQVASHPCPDPAKRPKSICQFQLSCPTGTPALLGFSSVPSKPTHSLVSISYLSSLVSILNSMIVSTLVSPRQLSIVWSTWIQALLLSWRDSSMAQPPLTATSSEFIRYDSTKYIGASSSAAYEL